MNEIKNAINKEIKKLDYHIESNLERNKTLRADELAESKCLLIKILKMLE